MTEIDSILRKASSEDLLTSFAVLTHRIHAAERGHGREQSSPALNLRDQRSHVQAEILRRMDR